jgi:hypothetical protein
MILGLYLTLLYFYVEYRWTLTTIQLRRKRTTKMTKTVVDYDAYLLAVLYQKKKTKNVVEKHGLGADK